MPVQPPNELTSALLELLENVDAERDEFLGLGDFDAEVIERLRKAFWPQRISDTLNIEGIQVNPRVTLAVMDGLAVSESDKYVESEIRNIVDANCAIEDLARDGFTLNSEIIKHLNYLVEKDLIETAGNFRLRDVAISGAQVLPPKWQSIESRIQEMCEAYEAASDTHPIVRAAWLHREFAEIHPFEDGNGRTARLLQDLVMIQARYMPVGIPAFRRREYYDALQQADFGDFEPLISMIANSELTALTKARRVARGQNSRQLAITRVLKGRQQAASRKREREYEIWRRLSDSLVEEANEWADEVAREAGGTRLMRVKQWDPLAYESWFEISEKGWARNSWVMTTFFSEPGTKGFNLLFVAKRLDKIVPISSRPSLGQHLGLQVVVSDADDPYDFQASRDPYVRLRAIGIREAGYDAYYELASGEIAKDRRTATEIIEDVFNQASIKAGWMA
ncbi:Fic family protein [Micromonospora chalcea]